MISFAIVIAFISTSYALESSSKLLIHSPQSLVKEEGYEHRDSLFGEPHFGESIVSDLYYADSDLCGLNVDAKKGYPSKNRKDENGEIKPWPHPFILMADRGGCTFVEKARNAQRSGASALIIAENICLCSDKECVDKLPSNSSCQTSEPIMADDGSGADITIPSFLLFKLDADAVKEKVKNEQIVEIEMSWPFPKNLNRSEYEIWTTPTDDVSRSFLEDFKSIAVTLGESAYFTPHYYIYDAIKSNCYGDNTCSSLCTNFGRYCATDPDGDLEEGISGADTIKESLRRSCIWKQYGEEDGIGEIWWNYVYQFNTVCNTDTLFMDDACIKKVYDTVKIDGNAIDNCMRDSGGLDQDVTNSILQKEIQNSKERGIAVVPVVGVEVSPVVYVNNVVIRGALTAINVQNAICSGLSDDSTKPKICNSNTPVMNPSSVPSLYPSFTPSSLPSFLPSVTPECNCTIPNICMTNYECEMISCSSTKECQMNGKIMNDTFCYNNLCLPLASYGAACTVSSNCGEPNAVCKQGICSPNNEDEGLFRFLKTYVLLVVVIALALMLLKEKYFRRKEVNYEMKMNREIELA